MLTFRTLAAEKRASEQQQSRGPPADEQRRADLALLCVRHHRVIEVHDHRMSRPTDRNQAQDTADQKEHAGHHGHARLGRLVLDAVRALSPSDREQETEQRQENGDDDESACGLQVLGQSQHGVVDLALHLSCALHHAVHPQALPEGLRGHDVLPDEGRHFPHRQRADDDLTEQADERENQTQNLQT